MQTIRWLNNSDNGRELSSNSEQRELLLQIDRISPSLNNTEYSCEVTLVGTGVVLRNITFQVDGNGIPFLLH